MCLTPSCFRRCWWVGGGGGGGEREGGGARSQEKMGRGGRLYLTLHCHHQNDSCMKMGSEERAILMFHKYCESQCLAHGWHGWCHMKLLPSRRVLCTPYNHAPCHFMQSHIRNLQFLQNDRDLLLATAVTRGWNGYPVRVSTES